MWSSYSCMRSTTSLARLLRSISHTASQAAACRRAVSDAVPYPHGLHSATDIPQFIPTAAAEPPAPTSGPMGNLAVTHGDFSSQRPPVCTGSQKRNLRIVEPLKRRKLAFEAGDCHSPRRCAPTQRCGCGGAPSWFSSAGSILRTACVMTTADAHGSSRLQISARGTLGLPEV